MPTYNYRCTRCDSRFEVFQPMADEPLRTCPAEGGPSQCTAPGEGPVNRVFGAVGITFKGSGFYKTDSRSPSTTRAGSSPTNGSGEGASSDSSATPAAEKTTAAGGTSTGSSSGSASSTGSASSGGNGSGGAKPSTPASSSS